MMAWIIFFSALGVGIASCIAAMIYYSQHGVAMSAFVEGLNRALNENRKL